MTEEINYDLLLEYLSYKKFGKWADFKKYVQNLSYNEEDASSNDKVAATRRMLSSLGHVEFIFGEENCYAVAPPAIALFNNSYSGVLCGYRTSKFLDLLRDTCIKLGIDYIEKDNYKAPKIIIIDFKNQHLIDEFQKDESTAFVKISPDFSMNLLKKIPSVNDILKNLSPVDFDRQEPNVRMYEMDIYSRNKELRLVNPKLTERAWSVYEASYISSRKDYFICSEDEKYYKIDRDIGLCKYFSENFNNVLRYYSNGILEIKYLKYIPELIDRALTLSGGMNRRFENKCILYCNISPELERLLSEKTGLKVKEYHE